MLQKRTESSVEANLFRFGRNLVEDNALLDIREQAVGGAARMR
jgi:hypothetical protein